MFCGCIKDIFCPEFSIQDSIIQLNNVLELLTELDNKYEKEIDIKRTEIKNLCKKTNNKNTKKLFLIKTIKLIEHQRYSIQKRMIACQSKQYQLESLNIAKIQINALKTSSHTFKKFMKDNDINKIEKLQDDFSDLIEQVIEINDIIKESYKVDLVITNGGGYRGKTNYSTHFTYSNQLSTLLISPNFT